MRWGWRWAFLSLGFLGFGWLAFWLRISRSPNHHPLRAASELAHTGNDPVESRNKTSWVGLVRVRRSWVFVLANFFTDPICWFYLFWVPDFLQREPGWVYSRHDFDSRHLLACGCGQRGRRVAFIIPHSPGQDLKRKPENSDADLRSEGCADRFSAQRRIHLGSDLATGACPGGTPGFFGKSFQAASCYVSRTSSRVCGRTGWDGGGCWRNAYRQLCFVSSGINRQLCRSVRDCWLRLLAGISDHSDSGRLLAPELTTAGFAVSEA